MINNKSQRLSFHWFDLMMSAILILMVLAGLVSGIYLYQSIRLFVANSQLPIFPEVNSPKLDFPIYNGPAPLQPTVVVTQEGVAEGEEAEKSEVGAETIAENENQDSDTPVLIDPKKRVDIEDDVPLPAPATDRLTVLIMGIDRRNGEEGPWRTDSMIVISIDPENDSVAMLSVPRDLYVTMPNHGFGEFLDRINQAFFHGDRFEYPGGGAALAMQTIRRNFGIQVDRYLVIDFNGFERIIDEIGGVQIDVPELLIDHQYPTEDYGYMTVRFEPGRQTMDGKRTLIYSRTRKSTSDFARAERQQQVILAIRDKVLSLDIIPALTPSRLARLVTALDDSIQTDLTLEEVLSVAQVAQRVKSQKIDRLVIDANMVSNFVTSNGAQVLWPNWDIILPLTRDVFGMELLPIVSHPTSAPTRRPQATVIATRAAQPTRAATRAVLPSYGATRTAEPSYGATRTAEPSYGATRTTEPSYGATWTTEPSYAATWTTEPMFWATEEANPTLEPTVIEPYPMATLEPTVIATMIATVAPTIVPTEAVVYPTATVEAMVEPTAAFEPTIPTFAPVTTATP